jgi:hypothetical protein
MAGGTAALACFPYLIEEANQPDFTLRPLLDFKGTMA